MFSIATGRPSRSSASRIRAAAWAAAAERQGEPVREEAVALADALERRGEVAAAAHVVLRRDLEEGYARQGALLVEGEEDVVDEVPAEPQAYARGVRGARH